MACLGQCLALVREQSLHEMLMTYCKGKQYELEKYVASSICVLLSLLSLHLNTIRQQIVSVKGRHLYFEHTHFTLVSYFSLASGVTWKKVYDSSAQRVWYGGRVKSSGVARPYTCKK